MLSVFGTALSNLLDVVVAQGPAILKLLASEDETLLVGRDALLVLDLGFHILNLVTGFDLERDCLAREGLNEAERVNIRTMTIC